MLLLALLGCQSPASHTLHPTLAERRVAVDVYLPESDVPAPLVVVAHGFARSRHRMEGWGEALADAGLVVAVPDLPYFARHHDNADGVVEAVDALRAAYPERIGEGLGLVGFSAGGLVTAVAMARRDDVDVWVGLDPVDAGGAAVTAAADSRVPAVTLFAEPSGCNAHNNGHAIRDAWPGPLVSARIVGATHCDPERPSNISCATFCGRSHPEQADAFLEATRDALTAVLLCDDEARARLGALDRRYADVSTVRVSELVTSRCQSLP